MRDPRIKKWFEECVRLSTSIDPELRDVVLKNINTHPRLNEFLTNLDKQIHDAQIIHMKKYGMPVDDKTLQGFVYDFAEVWARSMEKQAKERHESDLARLVKLEEAQKKLEFEQTVNGTASGEFAEAGVKFSETRKDEILEDKAAY